MSQNASPLFAQAAEAYLNDERDIHVQRLSFDDIARLASGQAPGLFEAYRTDDQGHLVPVSVTIEVDRHDRPRVNTTFAIDPATGRLDRSFPVGARLTIFVTETATDETDRTHLFTTKAAEKAAGFSTTPAASTTRKSLWLPLDSEVFTEESDGTVKEMPLAPFHGSRVSVSFVVEGLSPALVEDTVMTALHTMFGELLGSVVPVVTEPILDTRVDVFDFYGAPVAVNILTAEAKMLVSADATLDVRPAQGTGFIVNR